MQGRASPRTAPGPLVAASELLSEWARATICPEIESVNKI